MAQRVGEAHGLAGAVVAALAGDERALEELRDLLGVAATATEGGPPAYTVATLASALGVSQRVVRNAIARGELDAAKRGARWLIPPDAVDA